MLDHKFTTNITAFSSVYLIVKGVIKLALARNWLREPPNKKTCLAITRWKTQHLRSESAP